MTMFRIDENYVNRMSTDALRNEVHDYAGRWLALIDALRELPEMPSTELLHVLGEGASWPQDHERGKQMRRQHLGERMPPVSECEGGAGLWTVIRAALLEARKPQQ